MAAGLAVEEGDERMAARTVFGDMLGNLEQGGAVGGGASAGRQRGDFAEGVQIGGQDDDFFLLVVVVAEFGAGAFKVGEDVAAADGLPDDGRVDADVGAFLRKIGGGAVVEEAEEVHVGIRVVGGAAVGETVLREDDGFRAEAERADEALSGVVVEDDDGAFDMDAVEIVRRAFADVDDVAGNAFSGRGGRDDAVGAHRVELQRCAVLFVCADWRDGRDRIHEGRVGRAVRVLGGLRRECLGGVELLFDDLVRIEGLQSLEDVVRRRLVFLRAGQTVGFG